MPAPKKVSPKKLGDLPKSGKIDIKEVKRGAANAKRPGTLSGVSRTVRFPSDDYNAGYIAAKKDIATFMRQQGKNKKK